MSAPGPGEVVYEGRILIADDDEAFRKTTALFLEGEGYECVGASDGPSALKLLQSRDFDLLISDIEMPGNASLELIRDAPQLRSGLPVILVTGQPSFETAAMSVRLQVVAYLVKPPQPEELRHLVAEAIRRRQAVKAVVAQRRRLQAWVQDLEQIETVLGRFQGTQTGDSVETFLGVTFQNLLDAMLDVKALSETLARGDGGKSRFEHAELVKAVRETIGVLQHTRHHFKSKELGELRRKLEDLLRSAETPDGAGQEPGAGPI